MKTGKFVNWLWFSLMVFITFYAWFLFPVTVPIGLLHLSEALETKE